MEDKTPVELMEELEKKRREFRVTMTELSEEAGCRTGAYSCALCDPRIKFKTFLKYEQAFERILEKRRKIIEEMNLL